MRVVAAILCVMAMLPQGAGVSAGEALTDPPGDPFGPTPDSPKGLLLRLEWAYESRSADDYAALFSADFRFYFSDPDLIDEYPGGWTREDEIASARHLFEGFVNREGHSIPAAESIELTMEGAEVMAAPNRQDSMEFYRIVRIPAVRLAVKLPGRDLFVDRQPHEFWVVRGDAAVLSESQPAIPDRWYVIKWVESPAEIALAEEEGVSGGSGLAAPDPTRHGLRFALHPISPNPCLQPPTISFVLATDEVALIQVFDVRGRPRTSGSVGQLGPGHHRVAIAERLAPGVYWVRLRQGSRSDTIKFTLLR